MSVISLYKLSQNGLDATEMVFNKIGEAGHIVEKY